MNHFGKTFGYWQYKWLKILNLLHLLSVSISSMGNWGNNRGSISSMRHVSGLNSLTGSLRDLVVDISTGNLGDGVAVLDLNRDKLDLGVVNTVLGGNFTASMLDSGSDGVSNSVGSNWSNSNRGGKRSSNGMGSIRMSGKELRISLGLSLSLTLGNGVVSQRLVTDGVNDFLANLLVLNLLGLNSLSGAHILSRWDTCLGHKNLNLSLAVGSRNAVVWGSSNELGISLSFRCRCCAGKGKKTRNSKYLHHVEIVRYFPRWLVELK